MYFCCASLEGCFPFSARPHDELDRLDLVLELVAFGVLDPLG